MARVQSRLSLEATVRTYSFVTVDVFTDSRFGGNPLAVFTNAAGMSDEEMQVLARELKLSETTFVLPPENGDHTARVRIFNPVAEMAFAGHPNVGTALVLAAMTDTQATRMIFEEKAGLVEIEFQHGPDGQALSATVEAPVPLTLSLEISPDLIAKCIDLNPAQIETTTHLPVVASVGHPFVLAEVTPEALSVAAPDVAALRTAVAERPELEDQLSIHLYAREGAGMRARLFAPLAGTWEDPATGSANAALAAYLLSLTDEDRITFEVSQGVEMGRPSLLQVAAWRASDGFRASVSGRCVKVLEGVAHL